MSNKYPGGIITSGTNAGYSVAFDGTGDYLSMSSGTSLGAGNFTIECWVYLTAAAASETTVGSSTNYYTVGFNGNFVFRVGTTNLWRSFDGQGSQATIDGSFTWSTGQWYHMAWVRNSGTVTVYRNGTSLGSVADSKTLSDSTNGYGIAATRQASSYSSLLTGYISNLRIVVGTALYTAAFTPPTQLLAVTNTSLLTCNSPAIVDQSSNAFTITANGNAAVSTFTPFQGYTAYNPALGAATPGVWTITDALQAAQTRRWNMYDPYFNYTTLLLHGNGTNGAQNNTFLDSSSNNFTITRNGNTTQGTFSPFSQTGWGNYFDSSGSYLNITSNAAFAFGTGAYTVEGWVYLTARATNDSLFFTSGATSGGFDAFITTTGAVNISVFGGASLITGSANDVPLNTWCHVAYVRNSTATNDTKIYVNGVVKATGTDSTNWTVSSAPVIGCFSTNAAFGIIGHISNFRIVKGTAVYTSAFTPSTTPLTAIAGTSVLTCQSNRFLDTSSNAFTVTPSSSGISVQAFSPFLTNIAYTPTNQGGSGYFDGTGDYLSATGNSATQMGTGAFTWECWCYITTTASYQGLIDLRTNPSSGSATGMGLLLDTGTFTPIAATTGTILTSSINVQRNAWNHVALTRNSGGTLTIWVNGVSGGTVSNSSNLTDTVIFIGGNNSSPYPAPVNGYLSNTRITKGAALYTATFTPPTAPFTTTVSSGTVGLLLNFTNGGIIDATGKNVLETVGNAQISTTQSKFGGASMSFGSGSHLVSRANNLYSFGTGDFTVEMWLYPTSYPAGLNYILGMRPNGGGNPYPFLLLTNTGTPQWWNGVAAQITGSALSTNTWVHLAISRSGTSTKMFINGTQTGSTYTDSNNYGCAQFIIGASDYNSGGENYYGYIDDLRITKGYARYTANFTVQTSQWQDQ